MRDALIVSCLSVLPRRALSRAMGGLARRRLGRWATGAFCRAYDVDLTEAVVPEGGFRTLDELFVRRLKVDARPIASEPHAVVSPVDGLCTFVGAVQDDRLAVGGGITVSAHGLFGTVGGAIDAAVLYLSPRDYHRVHAPTHGHLVGIEHHAGTRWPVFPGAQRWVPELLARNERVVLLADADPPWQLALIGAFGVGNIEVGVRRGAEVGRGSDLGAFRLGSTVVLAVPRGRVAWTVREGPVRMGERIGLVARGATE